MPTGIRQITVSNAPTEDNTSTGPKTDLPSSSIDGDSLSKLRALGELGKAKEQQLRQPSILPRPGKRYGEQKDGIPKLPNVTSLFGPSIFVPAYSLRCSLTNERESSRLSGLHDRQHTVHRHQNPLRKPDQP